MRKIWKRVCTGILALATVITALPITSVHAAETQYWTESAERVGYIEHVMNDGTIHSTFNEGHMKVEGETAYCVDINTNFQNGYKTRHDASASMSAAQIEDVALPMEYVKQYTGSHTNLNANQRYLLEQCVVWRRLSEHLGWQCDNVRAAYSEIAQNIQIASTSQFSIIWLAPKVSSKLPGTVFTRIFSVFAPCFFNVFTAPFNNAPVILSFHSETTIPNFISSALGTELKS